MSSSNNFSILQTIMDNIGNPKKVNLLGYDIKNVKIPNA
jgi:hypothetical protein